MSSSKAPVIVVGTVFVDLKCFPENELNFKGRNLGTARFFHGGVGRNVAETMALLGANVSFVSSVQEGGVGREVLDRLAEVGINTSGVATTPSPDGHGMWVAILHRDGDLACSISQMPNVAHMEGAWANNGARLMEGTGLIVLELDLSVDLAANVLADANRKSIPVVGLPGNFDCIRRRPDLLPQMQTFVCNQYEAEELWGKPVASVPAAMHAAEAILARGLKQVVITLGAIGSVAMEQGSEPFYVPTLQVEVVDTTGAGDSFVAGLSHSLAAGAGLRLAVEAASRVAAWTVSCSDSVCRDLADKVREDSWPGWRALS